MILGAVLAGGRSRRFGSDKALAIWRGVTLIDHVIRLLTPVTAAIVVVGRGVDGAVAIADRPTAGLGPLGGLNAALHHARARGYVRVITVPCDTPDLGPELLAALASSHGDVFLADLPVIGCWRSALAPLLDEHLNEGSNRSVRGWAERVGAAPLNLPAPININFPEQLADLDGF